MALSLLLHFFSCKLLTVVYQERERSVRWDDNYRPVLDIDTWDQLHPINIPVTRSRGRLITWSLLVTGPIKTGGCWPSVFQTTSLCRSGRQQVNTIYKTLLAWIFFGGMENAEYKGAQMLIFSRFKSDDFPCYSSYSQYLQFSEWVR